MTKPILALVMLLAFAPTAGARAVQPQSFPHAPIDAIVITAAPIFVYPDATRTPLRTAAVNTRLRVLEEQADGWIHVEFQDPQFGRRVGYVEARHVRIVRPGQQPMDLSIRPEAETTPPPEARTEEPVLQRGSTARFRRGWIDVNLGIAAAGTKDYTLTYDYELFLEPASASAGYHLPLGASVDVGGGVMITPHIGFGVSFQGTAHQDAVDLSIRIPHPVIPNVYATDEDVTADKLMRIESAANIQVMFANAPSPDVSVRVYGGPTIFRLRQEGLSAIEYDQTFLFLSPVNRVNITGYIPSDIEFADAMGWGFHAGTDVSWFFTGVVGVGGFARFSHGNVEVFEPLSEQTVKLKTGGFQAGGGLRLRF